MEEAKTTNNLKAHFLELDKEHKCEKCDKIFQTSNLLKNHKTAVHDHKCEFSQPDSLKKHIHIVHEDHKDHKCEPYGKSFSA